jgi:hypothetical protein
LNIIKESVKSISLVFDLFIENKWLTTEKFTSCTKVFQENLVKTKEKLLYNLKKGHYIFRRLILDGFLKLLNFDAISDPSDLITQILLNFMPLSQPENMHYHITNLSRFFSEFAQKSVENSQKLFSSL